MDNLAGHRKFKYGRCCPWSLRLVLPHLMLRCLARQCCSMLKHLGCRRVVRACRDVSQGFLLCSEMVYPSCLLFMHSHRSTAGRICSYYERFRNFYCTVNMSEINPSAPNIITHLIPRKKVITASTN